VSRLLFDIGLRGSVLARIIRRAVPTIQAHLELTVKIDYPKASIEVKQPPFIEASVVSIWI
jgi:hypothetical protein